MSLFGSFKFAPTNIGTARRVVFAELYFISTADNRFSSAHLCARFTMTNPYCCQVAQLWYTTKLWHKLGTKRMASMPRIKKNIHETAMKAAVFVVSSSLCVHLLLCVRWFACTLPLQILSWELILVKKKNTQMELKIPLNSDAAIIIRTSTTFFQRQSDWLSSGKYVYVFAALPSTEKKVTGEEKYEDWSFFYLDGARGPRGTRGSTKNIRRRPVRRVYFTKFVSDNWYE